MDNGGGTDEGYNLAHQFASLDVSSGINRPPSPNPKDNDGDNDGLFQVIEAAEATIRYQAEENSRLRSELQIKLQELEKYKPDNSTGQRPSLVDHWDDNAQGPQRAHQLDSSLVSQGDGVRGSGGTFPNDPSGAIVQQDVMRNSEDRAIQTRAESHSDNFKIEGTSSLLSRCQRTLECAGFSQFCSPSPSTQIEGECDPQFNLSARGLMPMAKISNSSLWKQELFVSIREHEEEIFLLRKHLDDYSIKEASICNEKFILEKRIAYMRMAFDQQQQDLVDAASKALSYRQDIIEENIRLTYSLQSAREERLTFQSSLLPLLAEYSLQPPVTDAKSIVGNLKVLFKNLQEKLIITETKLKESQYQLTPWRSNVNGSNCPPQSPPHSIGLALASTTADWDMLGYRQSGIGDGLARSVEHDNTMRYSPLASRNTSSQGLSAQLSVSQGDLHPMQCSEETTAKQVTFSDPVSSTEMDDLEVEGLQNERDPNANWGSKNSPFSTTIDDPTSSYSPHLPPVLEEPSSSFSDAGDDDPLPAIEGLQISGEAYPGHKLQASGFSINGTTSCNFEWVRHLEDGSVHYIEGAKQPIYLVTADDIDTYLAIEVQPLDNRRRQGELVRVFANEHQKITCDPKMQNHIEKTYYDGHASYNVSLWTGFLDIWESATLAIKTEGFSIKGSGPNGVLVTEKFSPATSVAIPFGLTTEFSIISSGEIERVLRAEEGVMDISCSRDTIVLTLRLFIIKVGEKRKRKKRNLNLLFKH